MRCTNQVFELNNIMSQSKKINSSNQMNIHPGVPATTNTCSEQPCKKKDNPARAMRSRDRLKKFMEKKVIEKLKTEETKLASE